MEQERRRSKRSRFIKQPIGRFFLVVSSEEYEVIDVIDVSVTGIGLELAEYVDPGRMVRVIYKDGDTAMHTSGTVTYCETAPDTRYRIGIVFDYPHRKDSNLFYTRVREFLAS